MGAQIKLQGKQAITGSYARSTVVLFLLFSSYLLWGILTQAVRTLLDTASVSAVLFSAWEKLPPVVGLLSASLLLLLALLMLSPLSLGCTAWFLGGAMHIRRSGKWFLFWMKPGRAAKAADLKLSLFLRKAGLYLLYALPGGTLLGGTLFLLLGSGLEDNLLLILLAAGGLILGVGMFFATLSVQRYFLAQYILARKPAYSAREAMRQSKELMRGRAGRLFLFRLSFLPWLLLCAALIPLFYVWPYYRQSCAVWAQNLLCREEDAQREEGMHGQEENNSTVPQPS